MSRSNIDNNVGIALSLLAALSALILILIGAFLVREAWPVLAEDGWKSFITDRNWYPLEGQFGLMPMFWASLAMVSGVLALAVPLGVCSAIFLQFYAPGYIAQWYRLLLNLLAGIPSVVIGLWGLTELVPLITRWHPPGTSLLAAILVLSLMTLPTVALTSAAALSSIPIEIMSGAAALGLTRKGEILSVALPAASGGIISGVLLALARALGETMAVLMVAGNVVQLPTDLFQPVRALTANIALEMAYATELHRAGLFTSALLLTFVVLMLAWLATRASLRCRYG